MKLLQGDCLEKIAYIDSGSIALVLADMPYGTTARNKWDVKIPLDELWPHLLRVIKPNGVIALWSQMPFSAELVMSNSKLFRYEWIIEKTNATGFLNANKMPLKAHENVLIFYRSLPVYNPQKTTGHTPVNAYTKHSDGLNYNLTTSGIAGGGQTDRFPRDVLKIKWDTQKSKLHPTQKPVSVNEYFIRTYTNPGDTVLDFCMGSASSGVAAIRNDRDFIGIEKDPNYFFLAQERLKSEMKFRRNNNDSVRS